MYILPTAKLTPILDFVPTDKKMLDRFNGNFTNTGSERASDENIVLSNAGGALAERAMNGALVNDLKVPSF